jgi:hypothetical protein
MHKRPRKIHGNTNYNSFRCGGVENGVYCLRRFGHYVQSIGVELTKLIPLFPFQFYCNVSSHSSSISISMCGKIT